ncbi:gliding motility-associated C-terminal domain-containing protein [Runella sp.]|uniref:gliding motility-associated C-terminal domain-containing protein n=1 Tax=Runella sp. TaxID=1960881 RepID=UPI003D105F47
MNQRMRNFIFLAFALVWLCVETQAQRIYGGQIDRQIQGQTPEAYSYRIGCTFFADKAGYDALPNRLRFGIYRKKDNAFIQEFFADKNSDISGSKSAFSCNKSSKTDYLFVRYNQNLILKPTVFSDPDGYYIINDPVGNRNPTNNVASSQIVLYHWFSPQYLWEYFDASEPGKITPQWAPDSYNYFCTNVEANFSLQIQAVPLVSTLNRTNYTLMVQNTAPLMGGLNGTAPYRSVDWKAGYSESQMLPGGNFLVPVTYFISPQGLADLQISARPLKAGVYSIGFIVKHSRNGVPLSEIYREYQIQVDDCPPPPPANIRVSQVNKPAVIASARVCDGKSVQLNAGANQPNITYEWSKDGKVIAGQKDSTLVVKEEGTYSVQLTKKESCFPSTSPPAFITIVPNPKVLIESSVPSGLLCPGGSLKLSTLTSEPFVKYQWRRDTVAIASATDSTYKVTQVGNYTVEVIDQNGCKGESKTFLIKADSSVKVIMQALPVKCSNDTSLVKLEGTPVGGKFSGNGVTANKFSPKSAGAGTHKIAYLLDDPKACVVGTAEQTATVLSSPALELGPDQFISSIGGVQLNQNNVLANDFNFQWTPPIGLSSSTVSSPYADPDQTTTYQLTVSGTNGCISKDTITIGIVHGVYIPDAFTPNGDGVNDLWEPKGLEEFPDVEIQVFDRWGHAIYSFSKNNRKPFDGLYNGTSLPSGNYVYQILTQPEGHTYRGSLLLLR